MKPNEMQPFSALLTQIALIHQKAVNPLFIEIYWQALKGFEFNVVKDALFAFINNTDNGQYMPKPADLLRILKGSGQAQAMQAWSMVLKAIQRVGAYSSVVFDNPIIHAVISDMGGWTSLCSINEKEVSFKAQEFEKRYMSFLIQPPQSYPKQLAGMIDLANSARGFSCNEPVFIGDAQNALKVYQEGGSNILPCSQPQNSLKRLTKTLTESIDLKTNEGE